MCGVTHEDQFIPLDESEISSDNRGGERGKSRKTDGRKSLKVLCRRCVEGGGNGEKPGKEEKGAEQIHPPGT